MDTTIGGKRFPAFGLSKLTEETENNGILRFSSTTSDQALITLGGTASFTADLPTATSKKVVTLLSCVVQAVFVDASGQWDVSEKCRFWADNPVNSDGNQIVVFPGHFLYLPLNLEVNTRSDGTIRIFAQVAGGDVQRLSGITPGAGDLVRFYISISYLG
jgi:hypothetical protein